MVTAGDEGSVRVWDIATGDELADLGGGEGNVRGVSFSPDGQLVAAQWMDEGITRVFDRRSGEVLTEVSTAAPMGSDFSADGAHLALASFDSGSGGVVDVRTGEKVLDFSEVEPSTDVRFSPDGRWLGSAHVDGVVRVWDASTGELRFELADHTSEVNALDWSSDSRRLVTAGNDGFARVYELHPGGFRHVVSVSARDTHNGIAGVAFSPDGEQIMTGDWSIASVKVWDVSERAGAELTNVPSVPTPTGSGSFLADGRTIVAVDPDGQAALWDVETGRRRLGFPVSADGRWDSRLAPSPDGTLLAVIADDGARLLDPESGDEVATLEDPALDGVERVVWSPDSQRLALLGGTYLGDDEWRSVALIFDRAGTPLAHLVEEPRVAFRSAAFVGDGRRLAVTRELPRPAPGQIGVQVWDWHEEKVVDEYTALPGELAADPTSAGRRGTPAGRGRRHLRPRHG